MLFALFLTHPLDWLVNDGVGQNLTAGVIVFCLGWVWSRTKFWPLHALHAKLDALHERHDEHTEHLTKVGRSLAELHEKVDRLTEEKP